VKIHNDAFAVSAPGKKYRRARLRAPAGIDAVTAFNPA